MRSSILISRISRLVETAGSSGGGAELAHTYADAVRKANARMEAVVAASEAKGVSDAVRILSEDPPLIEEVSTLDFFQLPDWENLCDMNGWEIPPKIDKNLMERTVEIGENKSAIEPLLAMYKKAVRVNNIRLAVKSLRRLSDIDKSQDWKKNLKQSERQLQNLIVSEFQKAQSDEDRERLAQELLGGVWSEGIVASGVDEIRSFRERREAEARDQTGAENLAILKRCRDEKWDRKLAFSMVQSVDALMEKGWQVPEDGKSILADCRMRCAKELEAEEAARRWKDVNEQLHAAIQQEDCAAIRDALSLPEFLDRDPDGDLLQQARTVLEHADAARRRRTMQIAVFSFLSVIAVLGVSGWWLRQKLFAKRCADEVLKLEYLEKKSKEAPAHSIGLMESELAKLKTDDPSVYEYPNVNAFVGRLKSMVAANVSRTNAIESTLAELEHIKESEWNGVGDGGSVTGRFAEVEAALVKEDSGYRSRLLAVRNAWLDHVDKVEADSKARATKFHATLVSHLDTVSGRLKMELARDDLESEVKSCTESIAEWRKIHRDFAPDLDAALTAAETTFNAAVEAQGAYKEALEKLVSADNAVDTLEARKNLIEYYGNYPEVKALSPLEVEVAEVKDILDGKSVAMQRFADSLKLGISSEEFEAFLNEGVKVMVDLPEYYSLFALTAKKDTSGKIVAVSKGNPKIDKPSYETQYKVECSGGMLNFARREVVSEMKSNGEVAKDVMPSVSELTGIVDLANRTGMSQPLFERELLKLIDRHIAEGHQPKYEENEAQRISRSNPYKGWMTAYRRVQLVLMYMRWLKEDLRAMPTGNRELERWYAEAERLGGPVTIQGIDDGLAWLCIWDDRIKERNAECAKFLAKLPVEWSDRYKDARQKQEKKRDVAGWKVAFAGKIKFNPLDSGYLKNPNAIFIDAPKVGNNHPLYVLRKSAGQTILVKAFEKGTTTMWRMCADTKKHGGYKLGEPLYHVFSNGRYIDVKESLSQLLGKDTGGVPLFSEGGR